jgi:hypothetical protein
MKVEELTNSVVRAVVTAMRDGDRRAFFASFKPSVILTDDGNQQPFADWANREIFRAHGRLDLKQQNRNVLELVGPFHSDQWDMETVWRFEIADGRVRRLDVAALRDWSAAVQLISEKFFFLEIPVLLCKVYQKAGNTSKHYYIDNKYRRVDSLRQNEQPDHRVNDRSRQRHYTAGHCVADRPSVHDYIMGKPPYNF